ncbi:MAG: GGDEF domain-containing protein [Gemmatimonadales bacterium]|nr:MAG: GGDEF domain-containing protein [Gemmatimonadales bacterium]
MVGPPSVFPEWSATGEPSGPGSARVPSWMSPILQPMGSLARAALVLGALLVALLIGGLDAAAGPEIHLSVFYLFPIGVAAWFLGRRLGLIMALLCGAIWLTADIMGGAIYSRDWIPLWNTVMLLAVFSLFAIGLSHLRRVLEEEARLARRDLLTDVPNLRSFHEQMPHELRMAAGQACSVTLGLVEVHDLAYINERFGSQSGDLLLRVTARTLRESLRPQDLLCRVGGTTFAVVLPGTDTPAATGVLEKVRERVLDQMRTYDRPISIAIAAVSAERPPPEGGELMEKTDSLLRSIKQDRTPHPFSVVALEQVVA